MTQNDESLVIIDPVKLTPVINPSSGLLPLIEALNPIGMVGKAIVEIIAYRTEAKRLRVEERRIIEASKVSQAHLSAQLKSRMERIENQRVALIRGLDLAEKNLREKRVTIEELIRSLNNASSVMNSLINRSEFPPSYVFEIYRDLISIISARLVELERDNSQHIYLVSENLIRIVGDTKRDLLLPPKI